MRNKFIATLATLLFIMSPGASVFAEKYPEKPITLIVPFSSGDGPDVIARLIGTHISGPLGQSVVVQNKPGAGGRIGLNTLAQAEPDGYTLGLGLIANLALAPNTFKSIPYDPLNDFTPVAMLALNYLAIVADPDAPFDTVSEMVEWAKENPDMLTVGSTAMGGFQHISFMRLAQMADITFHNVPYQGSGQVLADLTGGRINVGVSTYTSAKPFIDNDRLRLLGITSPERDHNLPQLPTIGETISGYSSLGWYGIVAPAGVPRDIVMMLNKEINKALQLSEVQEAMDRLGTIPVIESPEYFESHIKNENDKYAKLVKEMEFEPL